MATTRLPSAVEAGLAELRAAGPLPDVPLIELVASIPPNPGTFPAGSSDADVAQWEQVYLDLQAERLQGLSQVTLAIVKNSEDAMNAYVPQRATDAAIQVVDAVRGPAPSNREVAH